MDQSTYEQALGVSIDLAQRRWQQVRNIEQAADHYRRRYEDERVYAHLLELENANLRLRAGTR